MFFVFMLNSGISAQEHSFYDNNIVAEINVPIETLKKVEKNSVLNLKITSDLTESQLKEWLAGGRNHYNVESIDVEKGLKQGDFSMKIIFKNGLDYATGKELFSGALLIDFFILNGDKIATNVFVSKNLTLQ